MNRPPLRVADVFRGHWRSYCTAHLVAAHPARVVRHIMTCRTAALGGHLWRCDTCAKEVPLYNSCQDRHCPTCQTMRKLEWLRARQAEILPAPYFHVVFTMPHALNPLICTNQRLLLDELFASVNWVLQHFAADPQWKLCGQLGFLAVLHTWTQKLLPHYHLHCLVPGGAWDGRAWRQAHRSFLFAKDALAKAFQARFIRRLQILRRSGQLQYSGASTALMEPAAWQALIDSLWQVLWIVYPKATARKPEQALDYLARYTHRVAIGDHRILTLQNGQVTFAWRDRADGNQIKQCSIPAEQFIGRFLMHVLPHGFTKVRTFGWLSAGNKTLALQAIRAVLGVMPPSPPAPQTPAERILQFTGIDITRCPFCKQGHLHYVTSLPRARDGPA